MQGPQNIGLLIECDGVLLDVHKDGHRVAFNRAFQVSSHLVQRQHSASSCNVRQSRCHIVANHTRHLFTHYYKRADKPAACFAASGAGGHAMDASCVPRVSPLWRRLCRGSLVRLLQHCESPDRRAFVEYSASDAMTRLSVLKSPAFSFSNSTTGAYEGHCTHSCMKGCASAFAAQPTSFACLVFTGGVAQQHTHSGAQALCAEAARAEAREPAAHGRGRHHPPETRLPILCCACCPCAS